MEALSFLGCSYWWGATTCCGKGHCDPSWSVRLRTEATRASPYFQAERSAVLCVKKH